MSLAITDKKLPHDVWRQQDGDQDAGCDEGKARQNKVQHPKNLAKPLPRGK